MSFSTWSRKFWLFLDQYFERYPLIQMFNFVLMALFSFLGILGIYSGQMALDTFESFFSSSVFSPSLSRQFLFLLLDVFLVGIIIILGICLIGYLTQVASVELGKKPRPVLDWLGEASSVVSFAFILQIILTPALLIPPLYIFVSLVLWLVVLEVIWSIAVESLSPEAAVWLAVRRLFSANTVWLLAALGLFSIVKFTLLFLFALFALTDFFLIPGGWLSLFSGGLLCFGLAILSLMAIYVIFYNLVMGSDDVRVA